MARTDTHGVSEMTEHNVYTSEDHVLMKDPAFWKGLKKGDIVYGREVYQEANDSACGWPQLDDLMSDEGRGWKVCRAGFDEPDCGCPPLRELDPDFYYTLNGEDDDEEVFGICGNDEETVLDWGDTYEWMVTHYKSGESDGPFPTYEQAKDHYYSHDEEWREAHYIEEVRDEEE